MRAGGFELRVRLDPLRAFADQIIDVGLIGPQIRDILLERTRVAGGGREAGEREQLVAALEILVKAFLDEAAERVPNLLEGR